MAQSCTSYLEQSYLHALQGILKDPLNQEIIEYIRDHNYVRFEDLRQEFVETGITKRDVENNVMSLYKYNLVSVCFQQGEDGNLYPLYEYNSDDDVRDEIVENAVSTDSFF